MPALTMHAIWYTTNMTLRNLLHLFTPYTDAQERAVGQFFKGLSEHGSRTKTQQRLMELLQRDIAVINLWTEYRYKGYKYLRKSERRRLYANLQRITADFEQFYASYTPSAEIAAQRIRQLAPAAAVEPEKARYIHALMDYFAPRRGIYEYRASSSFGRLLRDPTREQLIGDCNQILTLYIYLYSRAYDVQDLRIRELPGHVALHYGGIDIETTNGTFARYDKREDSQLLPIEEIVSINLLDLTDAYLATHEVDAKDFLQAARFAFILSHDRDIASKNLKAAYGQYVNRLMEQHDYNQALRVAQASHDALLIATVSHNGALHEIERHNYSAARRFAASAANREQLIRDSWRSEGVYHYKARRYHNAIKAFKRTGSSMLIKQGYEALFFEEQKKLPASLTSDTIKQHRNTVKHMYDYAQKSGNKKLIDHTKQLRKHL